jgi:RNA polymerase sigma-70 factor (ECF subfamily)
MGRAMSGEDRIRLLRLLLAHYEELTGYLTRRLGSPGAAHDVVHDTYLRLQGLDAVPEIRNPRAYLFRVADNIALDRLRADGRRHSRFVAAELGEDRPSADPSAEEILTQRQRVRLLALAIDELPPRQREVFLMHKFDGLSHAEISRRLGITRSMVEKHVMRALAFCRDRLKT